jgi:small nuclear ribonucleoprotein (snRNP)-like protein
MPSEPLKLLFRSVNKTIIVKLKDGSEYMGRLIRCDPTMNLTMTDTQELNNNGDIKTKFGKVLIRGNNILYIKTDLY